MKVAFTSLLVLLISFSLSAQEASYCLSFDGVDEHAFCYNYTTVGTQDFTLEMWIYPRNTQCDGWIAKETRLVTTNQFRLGINSQKVYFHMTDYLGNNDGLYSGGYSLEDPSNLSLNMWHHIAVTRSGANYVLYVDGTAVDSYTGTTTLNHNTNQAFIFGMRNAGVNFADANIDEIRLWIGEARSASEIRNNMHSLLTGSEPNLFVYYHVDDASGYYWLDQVNTNYSVVMYNVEVGGPFPNYDWVTSYAPIGNSTLRGQSSIRSIWQATGTNDSEESDGYWMASTSTLAEAAYATFGHNGETTGKVSTDVPTGIDDRLRKIWYVDEFSNVTADMTFDLTTVLGVASTADVEDRYHLLYRSGATGTFTDLGPADLLQNTDQVVYQAEALSDGYFTLGFKNNPVLPVELADFSVSPVEEGVLIAWATESEVNNSHFEIERSENMQEWEVIGDVNGAGNSNRRIEYSLLDEDLRTQFYYYRLVQYDFDGTRTYSGILYAEVKSTLAERISVFPNPVSFWLNVYIPEKADLVHLKIFTITGDVVVDEDQFLDGMNKVDIQDLKQGIYLVEIDDGRKKVANRMLVDY